MKLDKEEYRKAVRCLKRYNYNCINIMSIRDDIMSVGAIEYDGMPHAPNSISDVVLNKVIKLQENKELNVCIKEYKAVVQALALLDSDCKYIFEELFRKSRNKWDIIVELNISEETYKRRKRKLIYTTYEEFKKLTQS